MGFSQAARKHSVCHAMTRVFEDCSECKKISGGEDNGEYRVTPRDTLGEKAGDKHVSHPSRAQARKD